MNNDTEEKIKEKEKYNKKNKTEYEYTSSKQKNKFNMGIKINKLIKDNLQSPIPNPRLLKIKKIYYVLNKVLINNKINIIIK